MSISLTMRHEYNETPIPNAFIDNFMMKANPIYTIIYVYGLRLCMSGGNGLSSQELAENLNILESDVDNAWRYWEKQGIVRIVRSGAEMDIMFLTIPSKQKKPAAARVLDNKPRYALEELEIYQEQSMDIKNLFKHAERTLGKLLTYNDLNVIFGFYDWLRLPIDEIMYLFEYCSEHEHTDLRYIEKVAVDWAEKGINTLQKAKDYVDSFNHSYKEIMRALDSSGFPSASQRSYIDKWLETYHMPVEIIEEACDRSVLQLGRPKITYVDKILENWHTKNIRTLEAVKNEVVSRQTGQVAKKKPVRNEKKNRFVNFEQRNIDYTELERMEQQQIMQGMKG
jgi:DnaD/phage-associated family protein